MPPAWRNAGFDKDTFELMVKMRGAGSRLAILRLLEVPKHRNELSELAGSDWKEVDREVTVLERYGLIRVSAQSGAIKMYQITEQGKTLMRLMNDLQFPQAT